MNTQLNFEFDVRIPLVLVEQMMQGEITGAMLLTMAVLYRWADWSTGRVRWVSSGGLRTATKKAYSDRTFRISLQRLEEMGWITRHMVPGSHNDYPVTIHNYKFVDGAGKVHILNPKKIKVSDPFAIAGCHEDSQDSSRDSSRDTSHDGSQETSQKDLLNHELENDFENEFDHESQSALTNEGTNEESSPAARATLDRSVVSNSYTPSDEAKKLQSYWQEQTRYSFQAKDWVAAEALVKEHGFKLVLEVLHNTLTERAKSAEVGWRDFWFFAEKWEYNHDKYMAWKRVGKAKSKTKAAAANGHAARNPELHTGLDAQGESGVKDAVTFCAHNCLLGMHKPSEPCQFDACEFCGDKHDPRGFCPRDIAEAEGKLVGEGFDVEDI